MLQIICIKCLLGRLTSSVGCDVNILYLFFWVIPRPLNFIRQSSRKHCLFNLHRQVGMKGDWDIKAKSKCQMGAETCAKH